MGPSADRYTPEATADRPASSADPGFADGPVQHGILWNDPEQFGWISGGKLIPFPKAPPGVLAVGW